VLCTETVVDMMDDGRGKRRNEKQRERYEKKKKK
jgi:hypothetical protein